MYVYNHLMDNLRDLSENQVLERMQMIHQRMNGAYSMGKGDMVNQLAVALEMCKEELQNRDELLRPNKTVRTPLKV